MWGEQKFMCTPQGGVKNVLAAGSDLFSTHRGKEVVLVFNKDTGEALNIACNTESHMLQLF